MFKRFWIQWKSFVCADADLKDGDGMFFQSPMSDLSFLKSQKEIYLLQSSDSMVSNRKVTQNYTDNSPIEILTNERPCCIWWLPYWNIDQSGGCFHFLLYWNEIDQSACCFLVPNLKLANQRGISSPPHLTLTLPPPVWSTNTTIVLLISWRRLVGEQTFVK